LFTNRLTKRQSLTQYLATTALSSGLPLNNLKISFGPTSSLACDHHNIPSLGSFKCSSNPLISFEVMVKILFSLSILTISYL